MSTATVIEELAREQVGFELLRHPRTLTAAQEAIALGVERHNVGKTLILDAPEGFVRVVIPASERLDLQKAAGVLGRGKHVHLASEDALAAAYPMFELGAVPPIGGPADPVIVDQRLVVEPWIVVEAGTHEDSLRLKTADLIELGRARVADLCEEEAAPRP